MDFSLFRQFDEVIKRGFEPSVEVDLRPREVHLLTLLDREPNKPLRFYARHVHLERGSFTYLIENLEMKGFVKRQTDELDRRHKTAILTAEGQQLVAKLSQEFNDYQDKLFQVFSEQDLADLDQALTTVKRLLPKLPRPQHPIHHRHHKPHERD